MRASRRHAVGLMILGFCALGSRAWALPDPNEPVDPTKRAPISTSDAVRPAAAPVQGDGVIGGRVIRMDETPLRHAAVNGERAPVDVRETRKKDRVMKPTARTITARKVDVHRASDRPATIPRIDARRFQKMLRDYERDRVPAAEMLSGEVHVGKETVDLAEINRFVNPRAALEAQGIPVTPAGSGESTASSSAPVPVAEEQNGGGNRAATSASAP